MIFSKKHRTREKNAPKPEPRQRKDKKVPRMEFRIGRTLQSVLDGSILTREHVINQLPFIFFAVFLTVILIANTYYAERLIRKIDNGNRDLKELQVEYINSREKLMNTSKVSSLTRRLEGEGIREAVTPPYRISIKEEDE